jgi:putative spermidine/putrescine transport system ATP-binding protein
MTETSFETVLEARQLGKSFGRNTAVADVTFTLGRGEFLTMLGPSGSGKTTTLRIIAGFEQADTGTIRLRKQDITHVPVHRRGIGMVFQNYALFPHLSALQNVAFPLEMRGVRRRDALRQAGEALEMVELRQHAGKPPKKLSGGQQQRVALARAIVFEPDILLMDEPLGALDKRLRETMQLEIMRITKRVGASVIYVTHDQEEALVMSDRIAIYEQGRIAQIGTAEELYEHPASLFVADFIGESNILVGRLDGELVKGDFWTAKVPSASNVQNPAGAVALVVRPELMKITAGSDRSSTSHNEMRGRVSEAIYLGSLRKYIIQLADGETAEARVPRGAADSVFRSGDEVTLSWHPDTAVLVQDSKGYDPAEETA